MPIYLEAEPGKHLRIGWIMLEKSRPQHAGHRLGAKQQLRVTTVGLLLGLDRQSVQLVTRGIHFLTFAIALFKLGQKNYQTFH
jgi:hypothetical protein